MLLLHWDSPTIATILAPRLDLLFLVVVVPATSGVPELPFSRLYISPLMLELRMTFLAEELASPLNILGRKDLDIREEYRKDILYNAFTVHIHKFQY